MKKRFEKRLTLNRETLRLLQGGAQAVALTTTPIGTCPESDPAVCPGGGGGSSTLDCTQ